MGIEDQKHPEETASGPDQEQRKEIQRQQIREEMRGRGLSPHHARNLLNRVVAELYAPGIPNLEPAQRYEEHVRDEACGDLYMELSDPEAVSEFNALIDSFNADIERIKKEKDLKAGEDFLNRALNILEKYNA